MSIKKKTTSQDTDRQPVPNFIRAIIEDDLATGKHTNIVTRFPPEPNGFLHIGHAKSICLNFGLALDFDGVCHLRFDDTDPSKEEDRYVQAIIEDVRWLGFDWHDKLFYASDYFEQLYEYALMLIKDGKAYVCDLSVDEIRQYRGTLTEGGKESPYRNRSVEENLELFEGMKAGLYPEGSRSLRAKIDMSSPNINMRDPVIYRIKNCTHHRTGDTWNIYPMYDYTHSISDALEMITHSLCTLEFENHRPLYNWFLEQLPVPSYPRQIEFARLNLSYTVMSKRLLLELVETGVVPSWDDPRMPTLAGMRRRGFPPAAIREFANRIGVSKADSLVDFDLLQFCVREELNKTTNRVMAVLDPIPLTIENYPEDKFEEVDADNNPEDPNATTRKLSFGRELFVEREDVSLNPAKGWFRLALGKEVRLKHAYYITLTKVDQDEDGNITRLYATYDPESRGGWSEDGRKVRGTIHWVSAKHAKPIKVKLYDHLFTIPDFSELEEGESHLDYLNPDSLVINTKALAEPSLLDAKPGDCFQFLRLGYFVADDHHTKEAPVFNRVVELRDSWAKKSKK
ncbi:MAG TPA: glutamine--tRNA ligase/YqeY domain fusion protein [Candidatus Cloacimonetes bacterium]|nr:glutamine--tRNA ligase/YqeY domain fusion protein [Candidatus Cloacimonadota bacterium]